ncbi:MAG: hypothetical protein KW806_02055, partial [Candidatus Yanofskybacteria bacterium]|nr:hypothetical protein [Candidatus Yanofskybacteria bacterium]
VLPGKLSGEPVPEFQNRQEVQQAMKRMDELLSQEEERVSGLLKDLKHARQGLKAALEQYVAAAQGFLETQKKCDDNLSAEYRRMLEFHNTVVRIGEMPDRLEDRLDKIRTQRRLFDVFREGFTNGTGKLPAIVSDTDDTPPAGTPAPTPELQEAHAFAEEHSWMERIQTQFNEGKLSPDQFIQAVEPVREAYEFCKNPSEQRKIEAATILEALEDGSISVETFLKMAAPLRKRS